MSWLYITPEQGAIIESICDEFHTGYKENDCPGCPMAVVCKCEECDLPLDEPDKTREFEQRMWELANKATGGGDDEADSNL